MRVPGVTVVSVGNLAVGGTGKTPVTAWIAARLAETGQAPCVVVGAQGEDEARLHSVWNPDIPVQTGPERLASVRRGREAGATAVVLDDGFQALGLARDLDIVLLSAHDPFPGPVLPRGPYRERPEALERADVVVVTWRGDAEGAARAVARRAADYAPRAAVAGAKLSPSGVSPLEKWRGGAPLAGVDGPPQREGPSRERPGVPAVAVCGVARAERFRTTVADLVGGPVELRAYADHHIFSTRDARRLRTRAAGRPLVVTEKDAVKLEALRNELPPTLVVVEELQWIWGAEVLARHLASLFTEAVGR